MSDQSITFFVPSQVAFIEITYFTCINSSLLNSTDVRIPHLLGFLNPHVGQSVHVEVLTVDLTRNRIGLRLRHSPAAAV